VAMCGKKTNCGVDIETLATKCLRLRDRYGSKTKELKPKSASQIKLIPILHYVLLP
jgi:hypothetical protein